MEEMDISSSYQNQLINTIKLYDEQVMKQPRQGYYLERPRKESRLPGVLSLEEVGALIKAIDNLKHRTTISLIYSGRLRISEAINRKITGIDSDLMQMRIEQTKGKKDRMTLLSKGVLELLREYYRQYRSKDRKSLKYIRMSL